MTADLARWLPALVTCLAAAVAGLGWVRVRKIGQRSTAELRRMELLWQQTRGSERLDEQQQAQLGRSLYVRFDPHGPPWDDLDDATRALWHHQADRLAAEVASLFVARAHRLPGGSAH